MQARETKKRGRVEAISAALHGAEHVAIIRLGSIGDVIATIPLAWFLRDLLGPDARITWIVHGVSAPLLDGVAAVDEVVAIPKGSLLKAVPTWKKILAGRRIDAVLDVHGNLKSGIVSRLSGARARIGFHRRDCREHWNPLFTNLKLPPLASNNKTRRAMEIAELLGHPRPTPRFELEFDPAEAEKARRVLGEIDTRNHLAVLQLGRAEDVRSWSPESCAAFCEQLLAAGYSVLVLGGPPEEDTGRRVRGLLPEVPRRLHFEINTLTLREVGALLILVARTAGGRSVFVGGDSGCLHLAAGCGLRSIGLFGPQDPVRTAPVGEHVEILYHPEAAACIPCARRECFHETWSFCMKSITADEVARQVTGAAGTPESGGAARVVREAARGAAPASSGAVPGRDSHDAARRLDSEERTSLIWTLLLTSVLLALRALEAGPMLVASGRFPGLGGLLGGPDWIATPLGLLSGAGLGVAACLMGRRLGTPGTGVLAAALLPAAALFLDLARIEPGGGLFALLTNIGFLLFLESEVGVGARRRWCGALSAVAAFLAFLLYGVLGILLPALAVVTFRAGEKSMGALLRPRAVGTAIVVMGGMAAAYFVMRESAGPGSGSFATAFFEPLAVPTDGPEPPWTYVEWLATRCLPVSILAPFVLFAHLKNRRYREDLGFADRRWRYPKSALLGGLALVSVLPLKSPVYLIALLPSLAVLSAAWIERRWEERFRGGQDGGRFELAAGILLAAGAAILGALAVLGPAESRGPRWILAAVFVIGWALASRTRVETNAGLSRRVVLFAVVAAAAMP